MTVVNLPLGGQGEDCAQVMGHQSPFFFDSAGSFRIRQLRCLPPSGDPCHIPAAPYYCKTEHSLRSHTGENRAAHLVRVSHRLPPTGDDVGTASGAPKGRHVIARGVSPWN